MKRYGSVRMCNAFGQVTAEIAESLLLTRIAEALRAT